MGFFGRLFSSGSGGTSGQERNEPLQAGAPQSTQNGQGRQSQQGGHGRPGLAFRLEDWTIERVRKQGINSAVRNSDDDYYAVANVHAANPLARDCR